MSSILLFHDFYKNVKKFTLRLMKIALFILIENRQSYGVMYLSIFREINVTMLMK